MPVLKIDQRFKGEDVYIIGGGPSLSNFDWKELEDKNTIGCNSAFRLGSRICNICFFSDYLWFESYYKELSEYKGLVVTHYPQFKDKTEEWLNWMPRGTKQGLYTDKICYGGSSGCGAINLALLMGAKRVLLLGFDCKPGSNNEANWHKWQIEEMKPGVHDKFLTGFKLLSEALPDVFPGCEVINLTEGSKIPWFPFSDFITEKVA